MPADPTQHMPEDPALLVHAYLDDELDAATTLQVARQIATDPALAREFAAAKALRDALHVKFERQPVPLQFVQRVRKAAGAAPRSRAPAFMALAASLMLAFGLGGLLGPSYLRIAGDDGVVAGAVDSHIRAVLAASPADVLSSERHTVKPWFARRIPISPQVVDLADQQFPLVGGRVDVIDAVPVPTLVYKRRLHVISLSEIPNRRATSRQKAIQGFNVVTWETTSKFFVATSDLNRPELELFAKAFRAAAGE